MNKKLNTALFLVVATAVNILIALIVFFILLTLFLQFIYPHVSPEASSWASVLILVLSVGLAFIAYQGIMKIFTTKVDMEKYFHPIFASKYRAKRFE